VAARDLITGEMSDLPRDPAANAEPLVAPYGSWPSPISIDALVAGTVRLGEPLIDGDDVYWLEGRPTEAGRQTLLRHGADGATTELTPAPIDVRSRVHEYGGGAYTVAGGTVVFSDSRDGRLYRLDPSVAAPVAITPTGAWRYADLLFDPGRRRFLAVREDHAGSGEPGVPREPRAAIVAIPMDGDAAPTVLVEGPDFLAAPRLAPDGATLVWLEWDHPDMPWEATRLRIAPIEADGSLGRSDLAAGGPDESIAEPQWSPDGVLHLVSDRSGWWNLYRLVEGPRLEPIAPLEAEFADPHWIFDRSSYGFLADGSLVATARSDGRDRLFHIVPGERIGEVETPFTEFDGLRVGASRIAVLAASPAEPTAVVTLDPQTLAPSGVLRRSTALALEPDDIAVPESITFPSADGRVAHALLYRPTSRSARAPDDKRPPLVVRTHGGPTSSAASGLDLSIQFLATRGIAVVDVDYAGSTGYGRAYRESLAGSWGIADVEDAVAAVRWLIERGEVDPTRVAIEGGSAGGYTTLRALTTSDDFRAGISHYGIGDLELLAADTHKFESRYLDRLVGITDDQAARYRERSPIHHLDRVSCPVLILQGLDDRVVPPSQAESLVTALAGRGIPYAYLAFAGEGHGFRGEATIRSVAAARLSFLGAVFGFTPADDLPPLDVVGLEGGPQGPRSAHSSGGPAGGPVVRSDDRSGERES